jgi:hypothetical protein
MKGLFALGHERKSAKDVVSKNGIQSISPLPVMKGVTTLAIISGQIPMIDQGRLMGSTPLFERLMRDTSIHRDMYPDTSRTCQPASRDSLISLHFQVAVAPGAVP